MGTLKKFRDAALQEKKVTVEPIKIIEPAKVEEVVQVKEEIKITKKKVKKEEEWLKWAKIITIMNWYQVF